ncbi:MAG: glycosyltransferase family 4 protein [Rhizobiaceae bacterium]|nr:glycosyltransferase family 4 protein [Rhizobiaceae bacterium]
MRIAFYAPLKSPDHPVPSGDRQMARQLMEVLKLCGHEVELASDLRAFSSMPDAAHYAALAIKADREANRLRTLWARQGAPNLWFTYHPYYKAPDLLGPGLSREFGLPYLTAEASYSVRRNEGVWKETQGFVVDAVRLAAANLCFTGRDRSGLEIADATVRLVNFPPFIKPVLLEKKPHNDAPHLICVAMMRTGEKLQSYRMLAAALVRLADRPWSLTVVGNGGAEREVRAAFAAIAPERIEWLGQVEPADVPALLARADIFVWPGFGEAYGLAYLEAGAAALPVVAQRIAGVPAAVLDGESALLTAPDDVDALAQAVARLLEDEGLRRAMGERGRAFVTAERSFDIAVRRMNAILAEIAGA